MEKKFLTEKTLVSKLSQSDGTEHLVIKILLASTRLLSKKNLCSSIVMNWKIKRIFNPY
jgi:hypothetical protein